MPLSKDVTILMIDDDEVDVMGVQRAFRHAKLENQIVVANDGFDALDKLRDGKSVPRPYLVLLDLNMPRMNGIEFLKEMRRDPKINESIVFVLTTSNDDQDKHKAYRQHIAGYIVKHRTADGFINAAGLLEQYAKIVEFP